ncbi:MAG: aldehyde dehydrogenase family protein, partial [Phycisphaerae bacterium]
METRNLIAGRWTDISSSGAIEVVDPASDKVIARVPMCGASEALRALNSAFEFQPEWEATPPAQRAAVLHATAKLLVARKDALARIITQECGKPL